MRKAVKWISKELQESCDESLFTLIEKAALQFNLSPREEEYLRIFYEQKGEDTVLVE